MDALVVLVFVLIGMGLLGLCALLPRPSPRPRPTSPTGAGAPRERIDPCLAPVMAFPPESSPSPESDLYAELASGAISRRQYRDQMAALATRDDEHRHIEVPLR